MTEKSLFWTTGGAGDGASTYTRSDWGKAFKIVASCRASEGVAPNFLNECVGSVPGANTARIGTGAALVDGKPYENSAPVDVTITSAVGAGNTRIDRIVLRANWTAQTVRITRIAGTDAVSPTAPAITQTSETTYDIMLYQALVTTAGVVTLTDERVMADFAAGEITSGLIADDAVIASKIPDGSITEAKMVYPKPYGVLASNDGPVNNVLATYYIPFTGEVFDDDSMHDNVTNNTRLTCKRAGRYNLKFSCDISWTGSTTNVKTLIHKNHSTVLHSSYTPPSSYQTQYVELSVKADIALNDYVEVYMYEVGTGGISAQLTNMKFEMSWEG